MIISSPPAFPSGSSGYIQFNNSGAFGANSNFYWDNTSSLLSLGISSSSFVRLYISGTGNNGSAMMIEDTSAGVGVKRLRIINTAGYVYLASINDGFSGLTASSMIIDLSTGYVGFNTQQIPTYPISLDTQSARTFGMIRNVTGNTAGNNLTLTSGGATSGATDKNGGDLILQGGVSTGTGTSKVRIFTFPAGSTGTTDNTATERITILGGGNVLINGTASYGNNGQLFEVNTTANYGGSALSTWSAANVAHASLFDFNRSKSSTIGTQTIVASGDDLGYIRWRGSDGTQFTESAYIRVQIDGTPGTNDMPGRMIFATTADGASSGTERMRINNAGEVDIGSQTNTGVFSVYAADNATASTVRINAIQANVTGLDVFVSFNSTTGQEGSVAGTGVAGVIAFNTFTGSHWSQSDEDEKYRVVSTSQTTGKEKDSYATTIEPGTVLCSIDEMCYWENEGYSQTLPKYKISNKKEDKAVYGVHGGVDGDGDTLVLSLGSGIVLVTDEGGEIEIGDLLCTSSTPGYAMKYAGLDMSVVLAKARQPHKIGKGKIACSYYSG